MGLVMSPVLHGSSATSSQETHLESNSSEFLAGGLQDLEIQGPKERLCVYYPDHLSPVPLIMLPWRNTLTRHDVARPQQVSQRMENQVPFITLSSTLL